MAAIAVENRNGKLEGRRALITGASRGIGAGVAERFAAEGAALALVARTLDRHDHLTGSLKATADRCSAYGSQVELIVADLADGDERSRIVPEAAHRLGGPLDVLVNNAAAAIYQPVSDYPLKRRRLTFEVNVHAPFDLVQAALPAMLDRGYGWVVNVSSATALHDAARLGRPAPRGGRTPPWGFTGRRRQPSTGSASPSPRNCGVRASA